MGTLLRVLLVTVVSQCQASPFFNLFGGGNNDNDGSSDSGCRPGYEYITETTYETSYEQQCSTSYENECSTEYETECSTSYETENAQECTTVQDTKYETQYESECSTTYEIVCSGGVHHRAGHQVRDPVRER